MRFLALGSVTSQLTLTAKAVVGNLRKQDGLSDADDAGGGTLSGRWVVGDG